MSPTKKSDASAAKPKPPIKKVKVVNRGSEIKQMTATAEAARKSAISSKQPSSLSLIPQQSSGSTHIAQSSGRILIGKNAASRIRQRNDVVGKTEAPISQPKTKKIATEKKDGVYNTSSQRKSALSRPARVTTEVATTKQPDAKKLAIKKKDGVYNTSLKPNKLFRKIIAPVLQPKTKKLATKKNGELCNISSQRKSGLPILDIDKVATEAATTKRPVPSQNITLQRMANKAVRSLEERRWVAQTALDGLFPLMKTHDAIEIAVAALEKQIDDCNSDIQQLKRLVHSSHAGDVKPTEFKTILALASLVSCKRNTDEENKINKTTTKTPELDIRGKQVAREVDQTRPRDETLNAVEGNQKQSIKPPATTDEAQTNRLSPRLDEELFGPDPDLAAPISRCTNPISPSRMNTDAHPRLPGSKAVSVPRTHKPSNAPTACSTENIRAAESTKNDKLQTVDTDRQAQTKTQSSGSRLSSPEEDDVGGGVRPGSRASSEDKFLGKEKGVEDKRSEKRKHEYVEAEDKPNKKVHLSGQ